MAAKAKRVLMIVLDSFGCGYEPDADKFGDVGSNTLLHISQQIPGWALPNLASLGLGKIIPTPTIDGTIKARGGYGKARECSMGKDTTVGHWELAGVISENPLPTYPDGFPEDVLDAFKKATGHGVLGNKPASGTAILDELGEEHLKTGDLIVYTSADSVFQIAAHEKLYPPEKLYEFCRIARDILTAPHNVGRVIARPFIGEPGHFTRTSNRHDFSLEPTGETILDLISGAGQTVASVGKIKDIFAGLGVTDAISTVSNMDGIDKTLVMLDRHDTGFIFTNLVDFDMVYGHRRDVKGYGDAIAAFDARLPEILEKMICGDVLVITADHGCDPAFTGTDHTREYVPVLIWGPGIKEDINLGVRPTYADVGATVADLLGCPLPASGTSMADLLF